MTYLARLIPAFLFVIATPVSLYAQAESPVAADDGKQAMQKSSSTAPIADGTLPISNPFFQPYKGQFFINSSLGYSYNRHLVEYPLQFGFLSVAGYTATYTLQPGTKDTKSRTTAMSTSVNYAIIDRLIVGVSGQYTFYNNQTTSYTGSLSSNAGSSIDSSGFLNPGFSLTGRFLGTQRNEFFLDAKLTFAPGISSTDKNSLLNPQSSITAAIAAGKNISSWTFGGALTFDYSPSVTSNSLTYSESMVASLQAVIQYDFSRFYVRAMGGIKKYLDSDSVNDAMGKQFFTALGSELGILLTQNVYSNVRGFATLPNSADYTTSTFKYTATLGPGFSVAWSVGFRF